MAAWQDARDLVIADLVALGGVIPPVLPPPAVPTPTNYDFIDRLSEYLYGMGALANLDDLLDVVITAPADNEVLAYDNASGKWINQTAAEAGLAPIAGTASVTGLWTFNRSPNAPFAVEAGSAVVPNLDADKVDSYHHDQSLLIAASPTFANLAITGTGKTTYGGANSYIQETAGPVLSYVTDGRHEFTGGPVYVGAGTPGVAVAADDLYVTDKLEVDGAVVVHSGSLTVANLTAAGSSSIEVGTGGSGSRYSLIDIVSDNTYTDYGDRIIRDATGVNANTGWIHRGGGSVMIMFREGGGGFRVGTTNADTPVIGVTWARIDSNGLTLASNIILPEDGSIGVATGERLIFDGTGDFIKVTAANLRLDSTNQVQFGGPDSYIFEDAGPIMKYVTDGHHSFSGGDVNLDGVVLKVSNTQVVGAQQVAEADIVGTAGVDSDGTCRLKVNALLAKLRAHGLIDT